MQHIKKIYLYAVSLISLVMLVIASVILINLALKAFIFTKADQNNYYAPLVECNVTDGPNATSEAMMTQGAPDCNSAEFKAKQDAAAAESRKSSQQQDAAQAVAMILVAAPVFYYHWRLARKEA